MPSEHYMKTPFIIDEGFPTQTPVRTHLLHLELAERRELPWCSCHQVLKIPGLAHHWLYLVSTLYPNESLSYSNISKFHVTWICTTSFRDYNIPLNVSTITSVNSVCIVLSGDFRRWTPFLFKLYLKFTLKIDLPWLSVPGPHNNSRLSLPLCV